MATAKGKVKRVPPSRQKYEETHKTVSARLDPELQTELDQLKRESGMSTADIIRIGLNRAKTDIAAAYHRGMEEGFEEAREYFEVRFQCIRCGYWHQAITTDEMKAAAAELMYEQGRMDIECRCEFGEDSRSE